MRRLVLLLLLLAHPGWAGPVDELAAGRKLLSRYGWTSESGTVEMAYTVADSLTGQPEALYQAASQKIGLDLGAGAGREVKIVRYTLSRRSAESRSSIFAQVAFYRSKIIGAWLSTDAPVAPGIAALDESDFGHDF